MPSRTTWNGRSLVSTWRRTGMSSTCADATGFSFCELAASVPCSPGRRAGTQKAAISDARSGGADDVEDVAGLGQHGAVAAVELLGGGAHPLGGGPLEVGVDGLVVFADDVPARLGPPRAAGGVAAEQLDGRGPGGRPDDLLLFLGQVAAEAGSAAGQHPHPPVGDLDLAEC